MFIESIHNNRIFCLKNSELFRLVASNRDLSVSWIQLKQRFAKISQSLNGSADGH